MDTIVYDRVTEDVGYVFGWCETPEKAESDAPEDAPIVASPLPIPIPDTDIGKAWRAFTGEYAARCLGNPVAIPATPPTIGEGLKVRPFEVSDPYADITTPQPVGQAAIIHQALFVWSLDEAGKAHQDRVEMFLFDPGLHNSTSSEIPAAPFWSFDAESWTVRFDMRFRIGSAPSTGSLTGTVAPSTLTANAFPVNTSEEMRMHNMACADGRTKRHYTTDEQAIALIHRVPKASYSVRIEAPPEYKALGLSSTVLLECMERLRNGLDADAIAVTHYISSLFASSAARNKDGVITGGWVDLTDVAKMAIDKNFANLPAPKRMEILRRVYHFLIAGSWMRVIGERSTPYLSNGSKIDTRLNAPLWQILDTYGPAQPELPALVSVTDEIPPFRVRLALSEAFTRLILDPNTAQYLPGGEILAGIPKGRVPGAWANVMGYSLMNDWRIRSPQVEKGTFTITRRELLTRYTPKIDTVESLYAKEPGRVVRYYEDAIKELVSAKFVKPIGEAEPGAAGKKLGKGGKPITERYNWLDEWLDTPVALLPGEILSSAVEDRASKLPPLKRPKSLPGQSPRRRPKKPSPN